MDPCAYHYILAYMYRPLYISLSLLLTMLDYHSVQLQLDYKNKMTPVWLGVGEGSQQLKQLLWLAIKISFYAN